MLSSPLDFTKRFSCGLALLVIGLIFESPTFAQPQQGEDFERWATVLEQRTPPSAEHCTSANDNTLREATEAVEQWGAQVGQLDRAANFGQGLTAARRILDVKQRVDRLTDRTFELRTQFAARSELTTHRDELRAYLGVMSRLLGTSGRLRYQLSDTLRVVAGTLAQTDAQRRQFVAALAEYRSTIGAIATVEYLFEEPSQQSADRQQQRQLQQETLQLIGSSGQAQLVEQIAEYLQTPNLSAVLTITAAETIRDLGLPQEPRPGTPADLPKPAITAASLLARLKQVSALALDAELTARHEKLVTWLESVAKQGLDGTSYRVGSFEVQPGDWLLMRNPSPFNMFTDLTPGLFTHVGIVALETGSDGIRRMVLIDMPERGTHMPAVNVDTYLLRTLNYVFLRHRDPAVARVMAEAARSTIGNEIEFDLNFRTSRVLDLKQTPLAGRKLKTYCAGLLLLCALQTDRPRDEFFPVAEYRAGGNTQANLLALGMSIGDDFISPTGALFSSQLQFVGRREPMYDPRREIEESVFDAFAAGMLSQQMTPASDLYQDLRLRLAEATRLNPLLAKAIAQASNVSADTDLVSAAKATAVIDTLDEIAFGASGEFLAAREALRGASPTELRSRGEPAAAIEQAEKYRRRHADLLTQLQSGQLSTRQLRLALVRYYSQSGQAELNRRFFGGK